MPRAARRRSTPFLAHQSGGVVTPPGPWSLYDALRRAHRDPGRGSRGGGPTGSKRACGGSTPGWAPLAAVRKAISRISCCRWWIWSTRSSTPTLAPAQLTEMLYRQSARGLSGEGPAADFPGSELGRIASLVRAVLVDGDIPSPDPGSPGGMPAKAAGPGRRTRRIRGETGTGSGAGSSAPMCSSPIRSRSGPGNWTRSWPR